MITDALKRQIEYVLIRSDFYKNKYTSLLNNSGKLPEFELLPFTDKRELLKDQEAHPPFGSNLCVDKSEIQRVHKTSGTSNRPLIITLTQKDIEATITAGARCFISAGLKKSDLVIHCLNYNMWAGGYTDHQSLEKTGAGVIPFGVGNSHLLIETMLLLKPTTIHCTPSYLKKLELILKNDFNLEPAELGLKLGLFGAESGLQNPDFRKHIENTWNIKAMNANYGMADVLSMFGAECEYQKGLHFWGKDYLHPELIDTKTLDCLDFEEGNTGELVLSNLCKESQVLIRYRTNDIIRITSTKKCECGYEGFTFEIVGRSDDMIVVKGLNVFLSSIEKLLTCYLESITGVYQVLVNKNDPIDKMQINIELKRDARNAEKLKSILIKEFQKKIDITPELIFKEEGQLPRTEGKTKKLLRVL